MKVLLGCVKVNENVKDLQGRTPLETAVFGRCTEILKMLLDSKAAAMDEFDPHCRPLLLLPIKKGDESSVDVLLQGCSIDFSAKDSTFYGHIVIVIDHPKAEVVKAILRGTLMCIEHPHFGYPPVARLAKDAFVLDHTNEQKALILRSIWSYACHRADYLRRQESRGRNP